MREGKDRCVWSRNNVPRFDSLYNMASLHNDQLNNPDLHIHPQCPWHPIDTPDRSKVVLNKGGNAMSHHLVA